MAGSSFNDWDWYCEDTNWKSKFGNDKGWAFTEDNKTSIIATGDMSNVTTAENMFYYCEGLTSIPKNAFPNLTMGKNMFFTCTSLTNIPENAFPSLTNGDSMFEDCEYVQRGALGLYNNWLVGGKVTTHSSTFANCGKETETGLAELNQIPWSWGGLAD